MDDDQLITLLPLKRTWLDDIVDVFLKFPNGTGEVEAIVIALLKTKRDLGKEAEATVTRTINNFCINSGDTEIKCRYQLFEHVGPGKYKLLTYPNTPDMIEIQKIQFTDSAYQKVWEFFNENAKNNPKWENMSKRKRLTSFSKNILENNKLKEMLEAYKIPTLDI